MAVAEPARLTWTALSAVLVAMFAITVGYGVALPILPFLIEQVAGKTAPQALSWHTGLLTGAYIIAIFVGAPVWGRISDRCGRKPIILLGLVGFAATTGFFAVTESLPLLYLGRFLAGLFAAAITPVAYALIGDHAPSKEWRAHRFALINIAGTAGFFIGPLLGGLAVRVAGKLWALSPDRSLAMPLLTATGLAVIAAILVVLLLPAGIERNRVDAPPDAAQIERRAMVRLLAIALVAALAIGVFEVGLALRGKVLGLDAAHIGIMFAECSLVMAIVQALVFSPLIKPELTRWFIAPGLATLSVGLVVVSLVSGSVLMSIAVALVAASAGMLSPVATYWASLGIATSEGAQLGRMTAAASLGQALGSVAGGALFDLPVLPDASFVLAALLVLGTLLASMRLPQLLMPDTPASK
ncbi:Predicted MFS family arabinose efflux permease [Bosea sp. 62]|uniref:MFS transporter n=2 Tax=Hyphomicrobiales TaxID=356 RepID=UPI001252A03F|nr:MULTISPECIES: MFS transporter [Hyphomicrobiales]CAD5291325.1 Predicted MFS family arabinose efflux permease [Bosea sp. 21B]CAD5292486.1 Predicted MFS family arabinose efflux permease [Bosea sp. 46]CAD5300140.1 Predicted MFS family arabinose efflux permease [Bosea sp. 7B]VVT57217.1 Predicted MFS family arabinose efflux permease [Bosea sp. EC-HK365B]VXB51192.1 Predicted MFS family arabinose efflux permease [Bosea sp. 127]